MAIEHLEKSSVRSDPIGGGPVAPGDPLYARADQSLLHHSATQECTDESQQPLDFVDDLINQLTFVDEQRKHRQTTPGSSVENRLGIRAVLNVCTGPRARRLLRRASGILLVGGVAYLVFLALVHDDLQTNQTRIISADQKQATIRTDKQLATIPDGQKQSTIPNDKQLAAIPGDQKQATIPTDKQLATISDDQKQATNPTDKQPATIPDDQKQVTISGRSTHDAPPEERSSYSLTSAPPDVAIEPLKNSPLVSPDRNTAVPPNDGGYVVQVSAERSDAMAQASFKTLQSRYPHVLGSRSPLIRRVKLGEKGIFYRAQIGPFDTVEQAKRLCARLKSAGGRCMVQKNS